MHHSSPSLLGKVLEDTRHSGSVQVTENLDVKQSKRKIVSESSEFEGAFNEERSNVAMWLLNGASAHLGNGIDRIPVLIMELIAQSSHGPRDCEEGQKTNLKLSADLKIGNKVFLDQSRRLERRPSSIPSSLLTVMSFGDQDAYDDMHYQCPQEHFPPDFHIFSPFPDYDQARFHRPQSTYYPLVESGQQHHQLSFNQTVPSMDYTYEQNYAPAYPCSASHPPPRLTPPSLHRSQSQQVLSSADSLVTDTGHRSPLAGSLDPSTGIFYRTPEHPRLRTAQACEKCRTRKAKCSGEHPSCKRCLTRGLICQYAKEGRVRGPNKPKAKTQNSNSSSSSSGSNPSAAKGSQSTKPSSSPKTNEKDSVTHRSFSSTPSLSVSPSPSPGDSSLQTSSSASDISSSSPSSLLTSPLTASSDSTESTSPVDLITQSSHEPIPVSEHRSSRPRPPQLRLMSGSQEPQLSSRPYTSVPNVHGYPITPSHMLDVQPQSTSPSSSLYSAPKSAMAALMTSTPDSTIASHGSIPSSLPSRFQYSTHLSPPEVGIGQNGCSTPSPRQQSFDTFDVLPAQLELASFSSTGVRDHARMLTAMVDAHDISDVYAHGGLQGSNHSQELDSEPFHQTIPLSMLISVNASGTHDSELMYPEPEI
ncbi:hypothetical protein D9758_012757 [Tetrapyrgos nigripes]|uniref:Zn(2)-C6 fungal-type domain-containing protein n=1 Tax=Tetrapyrgos nigripes TaxID=182062 RepID=A0A8H5FR04_9AGAR|nr:hypothetical protein D9758_012757 [Tetrapyrgos nigripes]